MVPHDAVPILHIASRVIALSMGSIGVYMTLFLYEREEGTWEDRLVELWVSLDDNATALKDISVSDAALTGRVLFGDLSYMLGDSQRRLRFGFGIIMWLAAKLVIVFFLFVKLISPIAARVTYSLNRYKILTNKKLLGSVSALLLVYAFNLEKVGAKELLKLLG